MKKAKKLVKAKRAKTLSERLVAALFLEIEALKRQIESAGQRAQPPVPQVAEVRGIEDWIQLNTDLPKPRQPDREPEGRAYEPGYYIVQKTDGNSLTIVEYRARSDGLPSQWLWLGSDVEDCDPPDADGRWKILTGPFSIADIHVPERREGGRP